MKNLPFVIIMLSLFLVNGIVCSRRADLGGRFMLVSGSCKSRVIVIKKIEGFGEKYHLIVLYENKSSAEGKEFLGVNKGNVLTIYRGTKIRQKRLPVAGKIIVSPDGLVLKTAEKNCRYQRIR